MVTNDGDARRAGRRADAAVEAGAEPGDQALPEVLLVVLAVEQLVAQQAPPLVTGGVQGRAGREHQSGRIPARPSSSTSYASLRMRWST